MNHRNEEQRAPRNKKNQRYADSKHQGATEPAKERRHGVKTICEQVSQPSIER
jgi:hypothetical protein